MIANVIAAVIFYNGGGLMQNPATATVTSPPSPDATRTLGTPESENILPPMENERRRARAIPANRVSVLRFQGLGFGSYQWRWDPNTYFAFELQVTDPTVIRRFLAALRQARGQDPNRNWDGQVEVLLRGEEKLPRPKLGKFPPREIQERTFIFHIGPDWSLGPKFQSLLKELGSRYIEEVKSRVHRAAPKVVAVLTCTNLYRPGRHSSPEQLAQDAIRDPKQVAVLVRELCALDHRAYVIGGDSTTFDMDLLLSDGSRVPVTLKPDPDFSSYFAPDDPRPRPDIRDAPLPPHLWSLFMTGKYDPVSPDLLPGIRSSLGEIDVDVL